MTPFKKFTYNNGDLINVGDRVLVDTTRLARVSLVIQPGTSDAGIWQCNETGGVLIDFDDGDCWLCREGFDEDFVKQDL